MTYTQKAIERAIEGGYINQAVALKTKYEIDFKTATEAIAYQELFKLHLMQYALLDPLFWQALGKAEGWGNSCHHISLDGGKLRGWYPYRHQAKCDIGKTKWEVEWHAFIDHLAEGKDAESFFKQLLK